MKGDFAQVSKGPNGELNICERADMKRWALLVAGLYFLILGALTLPVIKLALPTIEWREASQLFGTWQYWLWLAVMLASEFALLMVPVRIASRRPITKGALWLTLLAGGLMMGGLALGAACALFEFAFNDHGGGWIGWAVIGVGASIWCAWLLIFFRMSKGAEASDLI